MQGERPQSYLIDYKPANPPVVFIVGNDPEGIANGDCKNEEQHSRR